MKWNQTVNVRDIHKSYLFFTFSAISMNQKTWNISLLIVKRTKYKINLFMNSGDVSFEVSCRLEAVVAKIADEVVTLVDATNVVIQIGTSLKLLATPM